MRPSTEQTNGQTCRRCNRHEFRYLSFLSVSCKSITSAGDIAMYDKLSVSAILTSTMQSVEFAQKFLIRISPRSCCLVGICLVLPVSSCQSHLDLFLVKIMEEKKGDLCSQMVREC